MTELSISEKGRMIAALRRVRIRSRVSGSSWRFEDKGARWTDEQIRGALGLSKPEFKAAVDAHAVVAPRRWTQDQLAQAVITWALRHKRWPTSTELDKRTDTTLPARSTLHDHFRWTFDNQASGLSGLVGWVVNQPKHFKRLTPQLIVAIKNVTVRRAAMEKYGRDKLLADGGGEVIQQDDAGKLWRMPSDNSTDAHMQFVEVENATPEPDGTNAHYFIRVPPDVTTARAGVAWSFNKDESEYEVAKAS